MVYTTLFYQTETPSLVKETKYNESKLKLLEAVNINNLKLSALTQNNYNKIIRPQ